uniref:Uncharacterized protein n=1 Tax=viral metagenome TaxID=1070528 RepID=A0A6M3K0P1_9ZZZZ
MRYQLHQKFSTTINLDIEILGLKPGSQMVNQSGIRENHYDISLNGIRTTLSESLLILFIENNIKTEIDKVAYTVAISIPEIELPEETKNSTSDEKVKIVKKKKEK